MLQKFAEKKKIIIVNNNMKIGGIQKALLDLLYAISPQYDVTLCLLYNAGEYLDIVPENVKIFACNSMYQYLGMSQRESKKKIKDHILRTLLVSITRLFGRNISMKIISAFSPKITMEYDCAISFMHNSGKYAFYGGCNDFVISKINAKKKISFLHCDYENCGGNYKKNNKIYEKFDAIAACSEGCRRAFLRVLPHLEKKTHTVINCHNFEAIRKLSDEDPIVYDRDYINVIIVARLSPEKGIDRALYALKYAIDRGIKVILHIVGNGISKGLLSELCQNLHVEDSVIFYGSQTNPYRYMKNSDFLFIPSVHEAAPLVIDEAVCLGVPILSTQTTSSTDMIIERNCGWVCENSQEGINRKFYDILSNYDEIKRVKSLIDECCICENDRALDMFDKIIN